MEPLRLLNVFENLDAAIPLPTAVRVACWAVIAGAASMWLYRRVSPQRRLQQLQHQLRESQQRLAQYQGQFAGLWPLVGRNLQVAMARVGWSLGPTLIAAVPLVLIFIGLDHQHQRRIAWLNSHAGPPASVWHSELSESDESSPDRSSESTGLTLTSRPAASGETVTYDYLTFGPPWMRSWIFLFVTLSTTTALVVRQWWGLS